MHKLLVFITLIILIANISLAQVPQRLFPQHFKYIKEAIKPNNYSQYQLDDHASTFYNQWKSVYLRDDCGNGQYYVWFNETSSNNSICVSEGQGYGMIITAYFAGFDPNAKDYFDGLYRFYKAHPSQKNPKLMAWNQVKGCIDDTNGRYSASDGDIDIAYALLLADKQWGSSGEINYLSEAINIIEAIITDDVNQNIWTIKLGDWVTNESPEYNDTRCSDFILNHFRAFQSATNNDKWERIINKCYWLINIIQTNYSPQTGLLPDFVINCNSNPLPASPNYLESEYDGNYFYNSCRTPLRIALDYLISGEIRAKNAVDKINNWIKTKTGNDPTKIGAGYFLNGNDIPDNNYSSSAFISPLAVSSMVNNENQSWLNEIYNHLLYQNLQHNTYYNNTLKLLGLIIISGNWWVPFSTSAINESPLEWFYFSITPNPFYESSTINYQLLIPDRVKIDIYNSLGERVTTLVDEFQEAGSHRTVFEASNLPQGVYYYTIRIGERAESGKLLLIK